MAASSAALLLAAGGVGQSAGADTQDETPDEPDITVYHGLTASPGFEEFDGCPVIMGPDAAGQALCLRLSVSGPLNFGDVDADIEEPMEMVIGIRAGSDGGIGGGGAIIPPQVAVAQGEEGEPQRLEGGLLGIPELDSVLAPVDDLTQELAGAPLWGVNADPNIGDPDAQIDGMVEMAATIGAFGSIFGLEPGDVITVEDLFAMQGGDAEEFLGEQTIGLPISVHAQNLLFGENCYIGTPNDPININLTTGTTEGVDPISGSYGSLTYDVPDPDRPGKTVGRILGAGFVDNTFSVPGASGCDAVVGGLLGEDQGLLDPVINEQTGLPSASGNNVADFSVDFSVAFTNDVYPPLWTGTPNEVDFGEVAVGESSAPETIVIENTGSRPTEFRSTFGLGAQFPVDENTCHGATLEVGDQCELTVRGTPGSTATHTAVLGWQGSAGGAGDIAGNPTEPVILTVTGT